MTNREVAQTLESIADILQIKDDNAFKIKAYRQAANSIYHLDEDIHYLYDKGRLGDIPGVGKAIQTKIEELIEKGSCEYYESLLQEVPLGVLDMLSIPGIGHKTVKAVYEKLAVTNLDELLQAAQQHRIRTLPGMGGKNEYAIIKGIEMLKQNSDKYTLGMALPLAEKLLVYLSECEAAQETSVVGSIRRGKPLVSDIDILVATTDEMAVQQWVQKYPALKQLVKSEAGHIEGLLQFNIPFEVIIVRPEEYAPALFWTTGSKEHRQLLFNGRDQDFIKDCRSETEVYALFSLDYIPPELREAKGEIEAAARSSLPQLVELGDIKGDLHVHSTWSDGASKIEEMAAMAHDLNYSYLAITDHSRSLPISGGLNEERLQAQAAEIDQLNQTSKGVKILKGTEVDILKDGSLDFSSQILQNLDIVIGSIHSNFKLDKEKQTERLIQAIKNPDIDIIGHLSGRLLNRRPAYELDMDRIVEATAKNRVILEINSHPDRLDIDADLARRVRDYDIKIAINSDAHHKNELQLLNYGVLNARRGWLEKTDIVNAWTLDELKGYLRE